MEQLSGLFEDSLGRSVKITTAGRIVEVKTTNEVGKNDAWFLAGDSSCLTDEEEQKIKDAAIAISKFFIGYDPDEDTLPMHQAVEQKEESPAKQEEVVKNNDGREYCHWCGGKTKKVEGMMTRYDVCTKCGR